MENYKVIKGLGQGTFGVVHMADSAAIALYLADRYPASGLAPAIDDPSRGKFLFWLGFTPGAIEPAMMEKFIGFEVARGSSGWGNYDQVIQVLNDGLQKGPWILGDTFTAADVKFTFERMKDPQYSKLLNIANSIASIDTPDNYTVVFKTVKPVPWFAETMHQNFIVDMESSKNRDDGD